MEINYSVSNNDYIQYNVHHTENSPTFKKQTMTMRLVFPIIFILITLISYAGEIAHPKPETIIGMGCTFVFLAIISILFFVFYPAIFRKTLIRNINSMLNEGKQNEFIGEHKLLLQENRLRVENITRESTIETAYKNIERIVCDKNALYIYTGSITAFIIPANAFTTDMEKEKFIAELKSKTSFEK